MPAPAAADTSAPRENRRPREIVPPPVMDEVPSVAILKSGVVDGMAYTLYSDGSIETEMAEGKVRFASIEALRTHLDQRGS